MKDIYFINAIKNLIIGTIISYKLLYISIYLQIIH